MRTRPAVGCAVGREQKLLVGREAELPDALTDQQITLDLQCCRVDDRYSIGGSERDERALPVLGDAYADRLNRILVDARDLETDLADDLASLGVDDGHCAADLGAHPKLRPVGCELGDTRPAVDQNVVDRHVGRGIDEVRHVGGFGRVHQQLPVRRNAHSLRLDTDRDLRQHLVRLDIDHSDEVIVLVGDIERIAGWMQNEQFRVRPRRQVLHDSRIPWSAHRRPGCCCRRWRRSAAISRPSRG